MKRIVFILLIIGLLACSEAVTLLATRAATNGQGGLKADSLSFYYKMDSDARFLDLKNSWQSDHRGELSLAKAGELATEADGKASVETLLEQWRFHGGPSPRIFTGKLHLHNTSQTALLNVPLAVTIRVKAGELRVNPAIQMTDFDHLEKTARWQNLSADTVKIAAIAPGEDMLVEVAQFKLLDFQARHPNQWPSEVQVQVSAPQLGSIKTSITLIPDHFVVPVLY